MFKPSTPLKNNRGSAILYSVFLLSLLLFIALEISKDSIVEYQSSVNAVKRIQAYYAAKSCTQINLLRIKAYQQAAATIGKSLPDPTMLDMLWQFPLMWPIVPPDDMSEVNKDDIKNTLKLSTFKHQFSSQITSESGKIDINDLASPSEGIRNKTRDQILTLFTTKLKDDSPFTKKYRNFRFIDLVNDMMDWVDADKVRVDGGSNENSRYQELRNDFIPPNQPFKTMEELHMVNGMTDEIFEILAPAITLYGGKGINVNYADKPTLMAIDTQMTEEIVEQILKRRNDPSLGGPFKDQQDFFSFIGAYGINTSDFNEQRVPLYFDYEINFNISCIGVVGNVTREINSVVYDFQKVQSRLKSSIAEDAPGFKKECKDKKGDEKYECLCSDSGNEEAKKKCIQDRKAADQKNPDQSAGSQAPAGPPYIIFQDVNWPS